MGDIDPNAPVPLYRGDPTAISNAEKLICEIFNIEPFPTYEEWRAMTDDEKRRWA